MTLDLRWVTFVVCSIATNLVYTGATETTGYALRHTAYVLLAR